MNMKKRVLSVAVLAAVGAGAVQATALNPRGLGEILLSPYYTVDGDNETLVSIVNTENSYKALKIRFREALNSREVLDFNIYMSPYDVWTAKVADSDDGQGAKVLTADNTCTVPDLPAAGQPFSNADYSGTRSDNADGSLDRTRRGYYEVIEMATLYATNTFTKGGPWDNNSDGINDALHDSSGVPNNCNGLVAAWASNKWTNSDVDDPSGGLYGDTKIINVPGGQEMGARSYAIVNAVSKNHANPGSLDPAIDAVDTESHVPNSRNTGMIVSSWANGAQSLSSLFMHDRDYNEYTQNAAVAGESDWTVTHFVKNVFVDYPDQDAGTVGFQVKPDAEERPYTNAFQDDGKACEVVDIEFYDREEQKPAGGVPFSPATTVNFNLCYEANVVHMGAGSDVLSAAGKGNDVTVNVPASNGMGWFDYSGSTATAGHYMDDLNTPPNRFYGLPTASWWWSVISNGNVGGNYADANEHRYEVDISGSSFRP